MKRSVGPRSLGPRSLGPRSLGPLGGGLAWLLLGCRAAAPTPPQPAPPSSAIVEAGADAGTITSPAPRTEPGDEPDRREPAAGLPHTCEIVLEWVEPVGVLGQGTSDVSGDEAKQSAWAQACAALQQARGLDCHDMARVGVRSEVSRSVQARRGDGRTQQVYEHTVELGLQRRATGFGDAPGDREQACRRAKEHACAELVQGPCPGTGLRVITVDGRPPQPPAQPPPAAREPSPTI